MSSAKRYSDANANASNGLFDKSGGTAHNGTGTVHRSTATHIGSQGNKQRGRSTGGTAPARLQVPRPVILPSKKKESQENDAQTQLAPSSTGVLGWQQRPEELAAVDSGTWTQHSAPRTALWNRGSTGHHDDAPTSSTRPPVLDQEEFPSLHAAAAQSKGPSGKLKSQKQPESKENKDWADNAQTSPSRTRTSRSAWEDDERFNPSGEMQMPYGILPGTVQHPGYLPMDNHGMPSEGYYTHPYYHSRPAYYAPHPGAMQSGYRPPDYYYGPAGEGYYTTSYMHTMYPHPHFPHGYQPPDMYHDHNLFPSMPHSASKLTSRPSQETTGEAEKETHAIELKLRTAESTDHVKAEAEHPKTPDNLSGEGTVRLIDRQGSVDDRSSTAAAATTAHAADTSSQRSLLRRMSLPKSASQKLKSRINSVDLDWGAQVEAEENFFKESGNRILTKPSEETVVPVAVSSPPTVDQKGLDETADVPPEATSPEGWQASNSPTSRETSGRDRSTDASTRRSEKSVSGQWRSGGGSHQNPPHQDRWQVHGSGTSTPSTHLPRPMESPSRHRNTQEGWQDRREGAYRDRSSRGRDGYRGRGRGGRFFPGDRLMSTVAVEGRKHFPGRGFRPKGIPPRQGHSGPGPNETPEKQDRTIQFGKFDMPFEGDYDPFSGNVPIFESSNSVDEVGKSEHFPESLNSDMAANREEWRPPTAPIQLDPVAIHSFDGEVPSHVYADHEEGRSTPGSRGPLGNSGAGTRMEGGRGGPRGRYSISHRGRHRGGRWSHGRHGGSMERFRHHHHPSSFSSASGTPTESERRFQRREGYFSSGHRWSQDFSARGRGDWHDRPFDRNPYHHHNRPNTRGGYGRGRGRGRGGREGGRAFQGRRSQDIAESSLRSPTSKAQMQWVPKKSSTEVTEKEQPAEE